MKHCILRHQCTKVDVTLYVRVWIETSFLALHPSPDPVTLYVRVWIETFYGTHNIVRTTVTLYVRVWIETRCLVMLAPLV